MTSAGSEAGRPDDDAASWAVPTRTGLSQVIREVNRPNLFRGKCGFIGCHVLSQS